MTEPIRVILVGRHNDASIPGVQVVRQNNIQWSLDVDECESQLRTLHNEAIRLNAHVLLQNTPAILAVTLYWLGERSDLRFGCGLGVMVQRPNTRQDGVVVYYEFDHIEWFVPPYTVGIDEAKPGSDKTVYTYIPKNEIWPDYPGEEQE